MLFKVCLINLLSIISGLTIDEIDMFKTRTSEGYVSATVIDNNIRIKSNGLPDHLVGMVTEEKRAQDYNFLIPLDPNLLADDDFYHLPQGVIGVAKNGVPIFNSFTPDCCDAGDATLNRFDACWGQIDANGVYYYNVPPLCLFKFVCEASQFIGVALDGLPIYGPFDVTGKKVTSADLDQCHGRVDRYGNYRYHVTDDFPYMIGCFRGTPSPDYVRETQGCSRLIKPCPSKNNTDPIPPQPTLPSLRFKRDIGHFLRNKSCCLPTESCDFIYNPNSTSVVSLHSATILVIILNLLNVIN